MKETLVRIYNKNDSAAWNQCVKSFKNWDIYYLYEYAQSFMLHGDGEPFLIYFENKRERFCYVVMQSDIAFCEGFEGKLEPRRFFDWETPYGYGGPLSDSDISEESQRLFLSEISNYCAENNIVSQFVRFHPLLKNYDILPLVIDTRYLHDTVFIDTSDAETIMRNMDSKNRNMVRKAKKNGVSIIRKEIEDYEAFVPMYAETMKKNGAREYYTFEKNYFESLGNMKNNACIFYAMYENLPISGAIMYYNEKYMHYHLAGSHTEYRKYAPGNLLLYEAACWANEQGIKQFHLGGGMSLNDSLFGFKKQFNKNGCIPFVVGKTIFNCAEYDELLKLRKSINPDFDTENEFMIQYRR